MNNTFSLRTCLAERETKLEQSEKFVDKVPKLVWITAISIIYILFGTNNTFSLRFILPSVRQSLSGAKNLLISFLLIKLV